MPAVGRGTRGAGKAQDRGYRDFRVKFPFYRLVDTNRFCFWYALWCAKQAGLSRPVEVNGWKEPFGDQILRQAEEYLNETPHPFYGDPAGRYMAERFTCTAEPRQNGDALICAAGFLGNTNAVNSALAGSLTGLTMETMVRGLGSRRSGER